MQLFTTLLNLEEVPKLNVVNSICYFLLYLSEIVSSEKSKQELEDMVDAAILRLAAGQSEAVVKQWAKDLL